MCQICLCARGMLASSLVHARARSRRLCSMSVWLRVCVCLCVCVHPFRCHARFCTRCCGGSKTYACFAPCTVVRMLSCDHRANIHTFCVAFWCVCERTRSMSCRAQFCGLHCMVATSALVPGYVRDKLVQRSAITYTELLVHTQTAILLWLLLYHTPCHSSLSMQK